MKAFVHIGLAKTGTSSIQSFLASNRDMLERSSFYFPRSGTLNSMSGHHCLAWSLTGSPKIRDFCKGFSVEAFNLEVAGRGLEETLIVSSEEFSSLSFSYLGVRKLLRHFPNRQVYVIAYIREQAEFFNSLYQEIVSDFADPGTPEEFVRARMGEERYDYRRWFAIWADLLGAGLIVRPFDQRVLAQGNVVVDFQKIVGLPSTPQTEVPILNSGWNNIQVAAVRELVQRVNFSVNSGMLPTPVRLRLKQMATRLVSQPEFITGVRYWGVTPELVVDVRKRYAASNQSFFESYGFPQFQFAATSTVPKCTMLSFNDLPFDAKTSTEKMWKTMSGKLLPA